MSRWSSLSLDVLARLFQHVADNVDIEDRTAGMYTLSQCQLTCKSWCKPAQQILYKKAYLGEKGPKFLKTLDAKPELGNFTRSIVFLDGFIHNKDVVTLLEAILKHCLELESIDVWRPLQDIIWSYLLAHGDYLPKMKTITQPLLLMDPDVSLLYPLVACKLKSSLTEVYLYLKGRGMEHSRYQYLESHIGEFSSLQRLCFIESFAISVEQFDHIIDQCCPETHTVYFDGSYLSGSISSLKPNNHITTFACSDRFMPSSAMKNKSAIPYINKKFKALERMQSCKIDYRTSDGGDEKDWWADFTDLCLRLQRCSIEVNFRDQNNWHLIKNCILIGTRDATLPSIEIHVDCSYSLHLEEVKWCFNLQKTSTRSRMRVLIPSQDKDAILKLFKQDQQISQLLASAKSENELLTDPEDELRLQEEMYSEDEFYSEEETSSAEDEDPCLVQ